MPDMIAVADIEQEFSVRAQNSVNVAQHRFIVARVGEIAETVAENERGIEAFVRYGDGARVALMKLDLQSSGLSPKPSLLQKKPALIDAGEIYETALRKLQRVPALPAADVQNLRIF